jgi:N-methylhydantoinase A
MNVGVDVGGTFTDAVLWDGERLDSLKVLTRPDQSEGVVEALDAIGARRAHLMHGTTAATNAVLERSGARTALVTDAGFEDLIEIGRQDRPSLYDTGVERTPPLVERDHRVGLPGRHRPEAGPAGALEADLEALAGRVAALQPEAVAVSMLYSYADAGRERLVAAALRSVLGELPLSLSCEVAPEFREFERASTTILDAYLRPVVSRYLERLEHAVAVGDLAATTSVLRSSGGLLSLTAAAALPVATLLSGPAGGVVAAAALGTAAGRGSVVSFDMGGTSTDVCRIDGGRPEVTYERPIDGLPCRMPSVAVHTVGAGGGSIAWVDGGGALRVGPRSAGAVPGPAAYGRGGVAATVTDANIALGRMATASPLAGTVILDHSAAVSALARVAEMAGITVERAALGVIEVVEAHMERAIRTVSVEEGVDPRHSALVAFGGAGGLHATALARRLDMAGVIVPRLSGVFSALGLLLSPPRADAARSSRPGPDTLEEAVAEVLAAARGAHWARPGAEVAARILVDARYVGQSHETPVPYEPGEGWEALVERFHLAHRTRNGFDRRSDPVEVVTVRAEVEGEPALRWDGMPGPVPDGEARRGTRSVLTARGEVEAAVWWRPGMRPGSEVEGPGVLEEPGATTFVGVGERATVTEDGALEVDW